MQTIPVLTRDRAPSFGRAPSICSGCARCERVLPLTAQGSVLWLWPPHGHTLASLLRHLEQTGVPFHHAPASGRVAILGGRDSLSAIVQQVAGKLTATEARDTRVLLMESGKAPGIDDIARVTSLAQIKARLEGEWVGQLIAEERIVSYFQPIVHAAAPDEVYGYEALLRGIAPDGSLIPPKPIFDAAMAANALSALDLASRRNAIRTAAAHGLGSALFINFSPTSIYDPVYCLRSTFEAVRLAGLRPEQIVFEITETSAVQDPAHLRSILTVYRSYGFRIAIDDMGAGFSSLGLLHEVRPDIIKIDRGLVQGVHADPYKAAILKRLLGLSRELEAASVVEGIEDVEDLAWAQANGATFIQGFLLGRPAPLSSTSPGCGAAAGIAGSSPAIDGGYIPAAEFSAAD